MSRSSLDCKIYVGDLPKDATEKELERAFEYYGPVKSVWVARNPAGFAFVELEDPRDAEDAVRGLDNANVCGGRVRVEFSTGKSKQKPWQRRAPPSSSSSSLSSRRPFDPEDRCYECGQRGHYAYDCRDRQRRISRSPRRAYRSRSRSNSRERRGRERSRSYSRSPLPRRRSTSRGRSPSYRRSPSGSDK